MKAHTFHGGEEFEVTEADMAQVAPLGFNQDDPSHEQLVTNLKACLDVIPNLPVGFWDAYLDEGDWECGVADCEHGEDCCLADHHLCTRPSDLARDDVFVRIPMSHWDESLQVYSRNRDEIGKVWPRAHVTLNGEDYTPEDCVKDLAALLAVFRFFVTRGDL